MTSATATILRTRPPSHRARRDDRSFASEEYQALWAMSRWERVAAMWRADLTLRQLSQWSSRAPHEVPKLGGEFAWIAIRTPEWAEAATTASMDPVPAMAPEVTP